MNVTGKRMERDGASARWRCIELWSTSGLRRVVAGILAGMVACGADIAWGQGMAPVNPEFTKWQQEREAAERRGGKPRGVGDEEGYGLVPSPMDLGYLGTLNSGALQGPVGGFPSSFDLRGNGRLTAVRNQGVYGTCWAHATLGSLESWLLTSEEKQTDFSENNMANLHGGDWGFDDGGNGIRSTAYLTRWGGPVEETLDPYPGPGKSKETAPSRHVQKVIFIPGKSSALDNDAIKTAVMENGALYVSYYHASSYYNAKNVAYYYPGTHSGNHAVAIVGWNDNYSATNFTSKPSGNGAYLVRNSWGTTWGNGGYFWVSYYDGVFAKEAMYSFCNAEATNNYGKIYQHDPLGMCASLGVNYGANMFTSASGESVAAVGFYSMGPKTGYEISIYTGCSSGNPVSGTKAVTQSGTVAEAGFTTIPLSQTASVAKGSRFSVVLKLATPGFDYPHAIEYAISGYSSKASAAAGQSFYSTDGSTWRDLTSWNSTANFCIKAYTKSAAPEAPKLSGLEIRGPRAVESGKTGQYACDAVFSDNSRKESVSATWSVTQGGAWATISGNGLLAAKTTTTNRTIVLRASYTTGGMTKTADMETLITAGPPAVPQNVAASTNNERSVTVTWSASDGAAEYAVYRGRANQAGTAEFKLSTTATKYSDTTAVPGEEYWYFVKAKNGSGTDVKSSGFSAGAKGWRLLQAPMDVKATKDLTDRIEVSWGKSEGGAYYRVARATTPSGGRTWLGNWQEERRLADRTCAADTAYCYFVSVAKDSTGRMAADGVVYAEGRMPSPVVPKSLEVRGPDSLGGGGEGRFSAHVVYSDKTVGDDAVAATWTVTAGSVRAAGTEGVVTAPVVSANGELTVTASWEGVKGTKKVAVKAQVPGKVAGLKVTSATAAGIGLAWNATAGARGYVVSRTGESGGAAAFKTSGTAYTDTAVGAGVEYSYAVAAENSAGTGPASAAVSALIPLDAPTGVTATTDRTNGVRVAWAATGGASHYRVGRATSATGTKTELGSWTTARMFDDASAKDNTEYWYFVKAATDADGGHASGWSAGAKGVKKPVRVLTGVNVTGPDRVEARERVVYACTATWSDGLVEKVSPQWTATAGSIGADGQYTAPAVAEDETVEIRATFGGKSGVQKVLVLAPIPATAEVTSVAVAQRWPFAGLVDIDYTLETAPAGVRGVVHVSAFDEDHGRAIPATTLSGGGADGPIAPGTYRITWDLAADYPGFHAAVVRMEVTAAPASLDAPTGVKAQDAVDHRTIQISWNATWGAEAYEVWRGTSDSVDGATRIATLSGTQTSDSNTVAGVSYRYWVRALNGEIQSKFSNPATGVRYPLPPSGLAAANALTGVTISWKASPDAVSYTLFRKDADDGANECTIGTTTGTQLTDTTAVAGVEYTYWVGGSAANPDNGALGYMTLSGTVNGRRLTGVQVSATKGTSTTGISVSWKAVGGTTQYVVYRGTDTNRSNAKVIAQVGSSTTAYSDTATTPGTSFYYWVEAIGASFRETNASAAFGWRGLMKPVVEYYNPSTWTDSWSPHSNDYHFKWAAVEGATSYRVYCGSTETFSTSLPNKVTTELRIIPYNLTGSLWYSAIYCWVEALCANGSSGLAGPVCAPY